LFDAHRRRRLLEMRLWWPFEIFCFRCLIYDVCGIFVYFPSKCQSDGGFHVLLQIRIQRLQSTVHRGMR
jgi:hypothetical protein